MLGKATREKKHVDNDIFSSHEETSWRQEQKAEENVTNLASDSR